MNTIKTNKTLSLIFNFNFKISEWEDRSVKIILEPSKEGVIPVMYKGIDYRSAVDLLLSFTGKENQLKGVEDVILHYIEIAEEITSLTHKVVKLSKLDDFGRVTNEEFRIVTKEELDQTLTGVKYQEVKYRSSSGEGIVLTEKGDKSIYLPLINTEADYEFAHDREGLPLTIATLNREWLEYLSLEEEYAREVTIVDTRMGTYIIPQKEK